MRHYGRARFHWSVNTYPGDATPVVLCHPLSGVAERLQHTLRMPTAAVAELVVLVALEALPSGLGAPSFILRNRFCQIHQSSEVAEAHKKNLSLCADVCAPMAPSSRLLLWGACKGQPGSLPGPHRGRGGGVIL